MSPMFLKDNTTNQERYLPISQKGQPDMVRLTDLLKGRIKAFPFSVRISLPRPSVLPFR